MSGFAFDSNIIIDALAGYDLAQREVLGAFANDAGAWVSRMVWIEVMSKGTDAELKAADAYLFAFSIDELDAVIAARAAALRRDRPKLRSADAVILASALVHDRVLVPRNTKDFPPGPPGVHVPFVLLIGQS